jgi:hypothetical protein
MSFRDKTTAHLIPWPETFWSWQGHLDTLAGRLFIVARVLNTLAARLFVVARVFD